jgi:periplasmic protein TonB
MFELMSGDRPRVPRRDTMPMLISSAAHVIVIGSVAAVPLLYMEAELPQVPQVLAFVATAPPPSPPPPPPAPAPTTATRPKAKPVVTSSARPVPIEPPVEILAETAEAEIPGEEGIRGGVEGGVPGGIPGGVIGGFLPSTITPPPPPTAPLPVPRAPVRVGGAITAPALLSRVAPEFPPIAVSAKVEGVVILEAIVDREGRVEKVKVLRSIVLLDEAAKAAVRQWRYSPLLLNGKPERFVVTVTVSFSLNS